MVKKIKLFDPTTGILEKTAIVKVLESHFWASGTGGGLVSEFENRFRKYVQSEQCVALNSGTAALHLALSLFDLKNFEVILPSLTFVSTAHAVLYNNARPIFVEIDPTTLCIDPNAITKSISKKTKAILPVHFAGMPANLDKIKDLCNEHNLVLIEDAAHAVGSLYKKKKIGSHGNAICFSFHPVKNLAMPNGGAIMLNGENSSAYYKELTSKRWCGISNRKDVDYDVNYLGWNYYMNEFSAAIGLIQLEKLDSLNKRRKKIANKYFKELNIEQKMPFNEDCSYHFYWICVKNRNKIRKRLLEKGIETGIHYKPIHTMSFYANGIKLPLTEKIGSEIITIPNHPNLTNEDVEQIIDSVNCIL